MAEFLSVNDEALCGSNEAKRDLLAAINRAIFPSYPGSIQNFPGNALERLGEYVRWVAPVLSGPRRADTVYYELVIRHLSATTRAFLRDFIGTRDDAFVSYLYYVNAEMDALLAEEEEEDDKTSSLQRERDPCEQVEPIVDEDGMPVQSWAGIIGQLVYGMGNWSAAEGFADDHLDDDPPGLTVPVARRATRMAHGVHGDKCACML